MKKVSNRLYIWTAVVGATACAVISSLAYAGEVRSHREGWDDFKGLIRQEKRRIQAESSAAKRQMEQKIEPLRDAGFIRVSPTMTPATKESHE